MTGFKAHDRTIELDKLNLIFGDNGTGKTTILDALTFAITGSTRLGATLEATEQLARPGGCMVEMQVEPDIEFDRALSRDAASKTMKMHLSIKGREQFKMKKAEEWVSQELGNFAPTFDINAFLGLSSDKRRDFVLQLCNAGEKSDVEALYHKFIVEYCGISMGHGTMGAHVNNYNTNFPEATPQQKQGYLLSKLSDSERKALAELLDIIKPFIRGDISNAITSVLDAAKLQTNGAKMAKDANDQAVRSISQRKEAIKIVSESAEQLKERKGELTKRKEDRIANLNERKGMQTSIDDRKRQIKEHESILDNIMLSLKFMTPLNVSECKQKIEDNCAEIEALEAKLDDEVIDLPKMVEEADIALGIYADLQKSEKEVLRAYNNAADDRDRISADLARHQDDDWNKLSVAISDLVEHLDKATKESWPWTTICELVVSHDSEKEIESLTADLVAINLEIDKYDSDLNIAVEKITEAKAAWYKLSDGYQEAATAADEKREQQQQYQDEINVLENANERLTRSIKEREIYLTQQQKDSDHANKEITAHKSRLEELLQKCDAFNVTELESEIRGLEGSIRDVDARLEDIGKFDQLTQTYQECIQKAEEENIKHEVGKTLCKAIRAVREDIMGSLILPLMDRMYEFLSIAEPGCKPFFELESDRGKAIFQLGWIVDDEKRVPLPAMSGGESVTFCAALAYAMVDLADPPLKLLMLEIGECDDKTFNGLIGTAERLCPDKMQAIVVTHRDLSGENYFAYGHDPWNVIQLTKEVLDVQKPAPVTL